MKQRYVITILIFLTACLNVTSIKTHAQSWRWGARGGSASFEASDWESVIDMDTDPNGNIYVLSNAYKSGINVTGGGASVTGVGRENVLITSYRCDGSFRWKKLIGGPNDNKALSLQVDSSGGVYAAFIMPLNAGIMPVNGYVDSDTTIIGKINKTLYLVKYDTAGNYKWLKHPQPDTMSFSTAYSYTGSIDISVDGAGNIYWLCYLPPASYDNGAFVIANYGLYLIKYSAQGVFQSIVTMDIEIDRSTIFNSIKMQRDHRSGRLYISGSYFSGPFKMGGSPVSKSMFVGAFNSNGNFIWKKLSAIGGEFYYRPVIDDSAHVYLGGTSFGGGSSSPPDTFNGYTMVPGDYSCSFIVKMDSNGNNLWAANSIPLGSSSFSRAGLALRNNNEVLLTGCHTGAIVWPGYADTIKHGVSGGVYFTFMTRFNAHTGNVIGFAKLPHSNPSSNNGTFPFVTISDGKNNVYVGGELQGQFNINGSTYLKTGGNTDFYFAKYGHDNCSCTSGPNNGLFSKNYLNDSTVRFTAMNFANDDTLYWDFGDNNDTSLLTSPTHTYSDTGTYNVCLTITNGCGDTTICDTVRINKSNSIRNINSGELLRIYPNPANEILNIDGIYPGSRIELYDVLGRKAHMITTASEKETIRIAHLPQGNYFIQITLPSGERITGKVLKQ